jgi:hypothetical protein
MKRTAVEKSVSTRESALATGFLWETTRMAPRMEAEANI